MTWRSRPFQLRSEPLVKHLEGITPEEIRGLKNAGVTTITELWEFVGRDPKQGISVLAKECGVAEGRLGELLRQQAVREAEQPYGSWFSRYWLELVLLLFAGVVLALVMRMVSTQEVRVTAAQDLPAYHLLAEEDIREVFEFASTRGFDSVNDAVARFTLTGVLSGTVVSPESLSVRADPLVGWTVLAVPVTKESLSIVLPGQKASLLLVPRNEANSMPPSTAVVDAIVLAISEAETEPYLVVAVEDNGLQMLSRNLGTSDIVAVHLPITNTFRVAPPALSPP